MLLNKDEKNALHASVDFISNAIDSAEDGEYYEGMLDGLRSIIDKNEKESYRRLVNKYIKAALKAPATSQQ
jgi:hypothetical protein